MTTHHYSSSIPCCRPPTPTRWSDLCERFGRYGMYSQEASESEIGQGLAQRHDAVMNFVAHRRPLRPPASRSATLAARTNYFRESYAYGDERR